MGVFGCGDDYEYGINFLIRPFIHILEHFVQKKAKLGNEGFVQKINRWLGRDRICGSGEWKAKFIVKDHDLQTGQNLDPKTVLSLCSDNTQNLHSSMVVRIPKCPHPSPKVNVLPTHPTL